MVKIPKEVMDLVNDKESTKVIGTVDKNGIPNAVALATITAVGEDTIAFAEIFHKRTKENLLTTKKATIFVVKGMKAYQIKGTFVGYTSSGPLYDKFAKTVMDMLKIPIKAVGTIKVEAVYSATPGEGSKKLA